jgi:hypothetical protein
MVSSMDRSTKSFRKLAREILEQEGKPLHYEEITRRALQVRSSQGATPAQTVCAQMSVHPEFVRVAEGVFALSKWKGVRAARFAKDIAYDILTKTGYPLAPKELGLKILVERNFVGSPGLIARNSTRSDPRFHFDREQQTIGLSEWTRVETA